jgi:hypothetical protein
MIVLEPKIARLAEICKGLILLETCVSLGDNDEIIFLRDFVSNNQALSDIGCQPTRLSVMNQLKKYFGHAYITKIQPDHSDFPSDWVYPDINLLYRSVFVGSKSPLQNTMLTEDFPHQKTKYGSA